ncbi:MAG: D-ribose pyranase [bacterium]|nr:D-ribose pyranase [bacterium]
MKQNGILHPELLDLIAAAGHGDVIVLADAGLRIPPTTTRLDLAITCGVPTMAQVVEAVKQELVIEAATVATEFEDWNPDVYQDVVSRLPVDPDAKPHLDLMAEMAGTAFAYVKTGECSAYSSVALVCGVNYLEEAVDLYKKLHPGAPDPF